MTKLLTIVFFLACCCSEGTAQEYRAFARRYSIEEGLPHRQVNSLFQDRRGFIWAATHAGLARFDGQRFKVFNQTESGLSGDIVEWAAEDAAGYIWAKRSGMNGWINILEPVSGTLIPADVFFQKHPPPVPHQKWWKAPLLAQDSSLFFSLLEGGGFLRYHSDRGWSYVQIPGCNSFLILRVSTRNTVWGMMIGPNQDARLLEVGLDGKILQQIEHRPGTGFWDLKGETADPDGFFIMEVKAGEKSIIWEIDGKGNRREMPCPVDDLFTHQCARLKNGRIKIKFPFILDQNDRVLLDIQQQFPEIDPAQYRDYRLDLNGNIWFATTFGLIVVELRQTYFRRLLYDEQAAGGRGNACRGLLEKNGRLLVNLETFGQGRFRVDPQTGDAERLPGNCGIGIAPSADGNVWTECQTGGNVWQTLSLFKATAAGQLTDLKYTQKKDFGFIWTILEENPQRVLLGHGVGMTVYNPRDNTLTPCLDEQFPAFDQANIAWLAKDRRGLIWACTEQGLFQLKPGGGVAARYWSGGQGQYYLPYDNIYHMYEDAAGVFWLGTGGGGLIRWDRHAPPGQQARVLYRQHGLLNGVVYAVYEDAHEHLWLPTDYGIVQFDKKNLQVRHTWLPADGLTHSEFNRVSHCQGADGTLYFGGLNGVTAFQPDDFYAPENSGKAGLRLAVSEFSVLNPSSGRLETRTADLLRNNHFTLQPDDRYVQLEFSLLEYFAPEKVIYTWKIEGLAAEWEPLKEPTLRLSGLPFGNYQLRIRAQAADGTLTANELNISLTVLPPFYLRWWFLLAALLATAAGIYTWFRWRTRTQRQEQERLETEVARQTATIRHQTEELKKLDQAKSRFFANVSHELRTPLTLILGPLSSLLNGKRLDRRDEAHAQTARQHGEQLLQLVNEILDLSKMESGKMTLHETAVSCQPFMRRLVSAFESHAERQGILFVFEYALPDRLRLLIDEDKLQKVLNNLLSNALKFTPPHAGGAITTRISASETYVRISVRDTGRGIHPKDLPQVFERFYQSSQPDTPVEGGTGIGLALCREFAGVMQGRIWAESTLGQGSTFYFEFPRKEVLGAGETEPEHAGLPAPGATEMLQAPPAASPAAHPAATILLVEDNDSLRDYVQSILAEQYRVVTAENGRAALDLLAERAAALPELILSDVMMPVMDGFQLLEQLKSDERWRHIPVVMLTARAELRDKLRALRIGVDDYLLKPFEEDELLARVDNLLRHYQARQTATAVPDIGAAADAGIAPGADVKKGSPEDQEWLERLETMVAGHLDDSRLSADWLAYNLFTGRNLFFKKVKQLTGMTPNEYIQEVRLTKARQLLETGDSRSVKEAAYSVGVKDVKYFSEQFKKRFGKSPSEYRW